VQRHQNAELSGIVGLPTLGRAAVAPAASVALWALAAALPTGLAVEAINPLDVGAGGSSGSDLATAGQQRCMG